MTQQATVATYLYVIVAVDNRWGACEHQSLDALSPTGSDDIFYNSMTCSDGPQVSESTQRLEG